MSNAHLASEFIQDLDNIIYESKEGFDATLKHHYHVAIAVLVDVPQTFAEERLNVLFNTCEPACFAFAYDHVRECFRRGYVLSYTEYEELNRRFPRVR